MRQFQSLRPGSKQQMDQPGGTQSNVKWCILHWCQEKHGFNSSSGHAVIHTTLAVFKLSTWEGVWEGGGDSMTFQFTR